MVSGAKIEFFDPTVEPTKKGTLSPRLDGLGGKTIGVLWNGRAQGDEVLSRVVSILKEQHGIRAVVFRSKPYIGNIAPKEIIDELISTCDAVVTGVGD